MQASNSEPLFQEARLPRLAFFYLAVVATGFFLPSDGNHGLLNPKALFLVLALLGAGADFVFSHSLSIKKASLILFAALALTVYFFWTCLFTVRGDLQAFDNTFDQLKIFGTTLIAAVLARYWDLSSPRLFPTLLKTAIWANLAYSTCKLILCILCFLGILNIMQVMNILGIDLMTTGISKGVGRIQTSVDIPTPYLLFFVLQSALLKINLSKKLKTLYIAVTIPSLFLSFSRFLWAVAFLAVFLHLASLNNFKRIAIALGTCLLLGLGFVLFFGGEEIVTIFMNRFFSDETDASDMIRAHQIEALLSQFYEHPFFGWGMGSFSSECIRDANHPHYYEVQWVAFLMQFGLIGIALLVTLTLPIFIAYFKLPLTRIKASFGSLFVIWLLSGFTNPFLISLNSGIMYGLFFIISCRLSSDLSSTKIRV